MIQNHPYQWHVVDHHHHFALAPLPSHLREGKAEARLAQGSVAQRDHPLCLGRVSGEVPTRKWLRLATQVPMSVTVRGSHRPDCLPPLAVCSCRSKMRKRKIVRLEPSRSRGSGSEKCHPNQGHPKRIGKLAAHSSDRYEPYGLIPLEMRKKKLDTNGE